MSDVIGLGQPGCSLRCLEAKPLGDVAEAICGGWFQSALELPSEGISTQSRLIRSKILKSILEIGNAQGYQYFVPLMPKIASIAIKPTATPPEVSLEAILLAFFVSYLGLF